MIKIIQPIKTATRRTINRVREYGPRFIIEEWDASVSCFGGMGGVKVRSLNNEDEWTGWLPESEIILID